MSRTPLDYLRDACEHMQRAHQFVAGMQYSSFVRDDKTNFAVVRALEIVGEATKNIPDDIRTRFPDVPWRQMAGIRDVLIHAYFGIDLEVVWKTATERAPETLVALSKALEILEAEEASE